MNATENETQSPGSPHRAGEKPKRRKRRWLQGLIVLLVVLAALVALAPWIASSGPVVDFALDRYNSGIAGSVTVEDVDLGWSGPTRIEGVTVRGPDGQVLARLEVASVPGGAWSLATAPLAFEELTLRGRDVLLAVDEQGRLSLAEAFQPARPAQPGKPRPPGDLPEPSGTVVWELTDVTFRNPVGREYTLSSVTGQARLDTLDRIDGQVQIVAAGGGRLSAEWSVTDLTDAGRLNAAGSQGQASVRSTESVQLAGLADLVGLDAMQGLVDPNVTLRWSPGDLRSTGRLGAADLQAPRHLGDRVRPLNATLTWAIEPQPADRIAVRSSLQSDAAGLDLSADVPRALPDDWPAPADLVTDLLAGRAIRLPEGRAEVQGRMDLEQLADAVPGLLRLRPDVTVLAGRVRFDANARGGATPSLSGSVDLSELVTRRGEQRYDWQGLDVNVAVNQSADGPATARLRADLGQAGRVRLTGTVADPCASVRLDLDQARQMLARVVDPGEIELAGTVALKAWGSRQDEDQLVWQMDGQAPRGLRLAWSAGGVDLPPTSLTGSGQWRTTGPERWRLDAEAARLDVRDVVALDASGMYEHPAGAAEATAEIRRGSLERLAGLLAGVGVELPWSLAGQPSGTVRFARVSADAPWVLGTGSVAVSRLRLAERSLGDAPVTLTWRDVRLQPTGGARAGEVRLTSDPLKLTAAQVSYDPVAGSAPRLSGTVDLTGELARLIPLTVALGGDPNAAGPDLAGTLRVTGDVATAGRTVTADVSGGVDSLRVPIGADRYQTEDVEFAIRTELDPREEVLSVRTGSFTSPLLRLRVAGTVSDYAGRRVFDLEGDYRGDWSRIMPLVHELAPATRKTVRLTGDSQGQFTLTGPANQLAVSPSYRGMDGRTAVGFGGGRVFGIDLGAGQVQPRFENARITIPPAKVPAGGGALNLAGTVDLAGDVPVLSIPGKVQVIDQVRITPEMGEQLLSYLNPVFASMAKVDGRVTLRSDGLVLPLGRTIYVGGGGTGHLDLSDLDVQPAGLLARLVTLAGLSPDDPNGRLIRASGVAFRVSDGRIHYDDFTLLLAEKLDLRFHGSVGFDDSLDLAVSLPINTALLERLGVSGRAADYARVLSAARVEIPILGTRLEPKLDLSRVDIRPLIRQAAERLMLEGAGRLLEDTLRREREGDAETPSGDPNARERPPIIGPLPLPRPDANDRDPLRDLFGEILRRGRERRERSDEPGGQTPKKE